MRRAERQDMATAIDNSSVLYLVEYYNDGGCNRHYDTHDGNHDGGGGYYDAGGGHVGDDLFDDGSYVGCGVYDGNPPPVSLLFLYLLYYTYCPQSFSGGALYSK